VAQAIAISDAPEFVLQLEARTQRSCLVVSVIR
jgi:hypothetical protein